jgi:hypothetical protein
MGRLILCFIAGSLLLATASFGADSTVSLSDLEAQATTEAAEAGKVAPASTEAATDYSRYRMAEESNRLILALSVMGAGVLSLFIVLAYLRSIGAAPESVVTGSGLVLVVFATVLIVILVKRDEQLTAATGILGAIAGYLFGKAAKSHDAEQKQDKVGTT